MWEAVTNASYNGVPTYLGIVQMLIHHLGQAMYIQCPSVSVADITDCATHGGINGATQGGEFDLHR